MLTLFRPNVKKLEAEGNVEGLIRALQYSDINEPWSHQPREVRCLAAEALGKIGGVSAIEPLIASLKDEDQTVRQESANALETLHQLGLPVIERLITTLKRDKDLEIRQVSATALETLNWQPGQDEDGATFWIVKGEWDKCREIGAPAVLPLVDALCQGDLEVQEAVARTLVQLADRRAIDPLIAVLKDRGRSVREVSASVLKKLHRLGLPVVERLIATLKSKNSEMRQAAARALETLNWQPNSDEDEATFWIVKGEWDKCEEIGWTVVIPIINAFKDKTARVSLQKYLIARLKDKQIDIRVKATEALAEVGDITVAYPLVRSLPFSCSANWRTGYSTNNSLTCVSWDSDKESDFQDYKLQVVSASKALAEIYKYEPDKLIKLFQKLRFNGRFINRSDIWMGIPIIWALCEIGNRKATETIVNWIFDLGGHIPDPSALAWTYNRFHEIRSVTYFLRDIIPPDVLPKLLGDYTDLLLDLLTWKVSSIYRELLIQGEGNFGELMSYALSTWGQNKDAEFDFSICTEALQKFCLRDTPVANNILCKFLQNPEKIELSSYKVENPTSTTYFTNYLNCGNLHTIVRVILRDRHWPHYIPSAYLDEIYFENPKTSSSPSEKQNTA